MPPTQAQIEQFVTALNTTTQREVIHISLSLADNLALTDSKFGGTPYIPKDGTLPTSVGEYFVPQKRTLAVLDSGYGRLSIWLRPQQFL